MKIIDSVEQPAGLRIISERPLFACALMLALGIIAGAKGATQALWCAMGALVVLMFVLFCGRLGTLPLALVLLAAGFFSARAALPAWLGEDPWRSGVPVAVQGTVRGSEILTGSKQRLLLAELTIDGQPTQGYAQITLDAIPVAHGDRLAVHSTLYQPEPAVYKGGFDAQAYYMRHGIRFLGKADSATVLAQGQGALRFVMSAMQRARLYAARTLDTALRGDARSVVYALITGSKTGMDDILRTDFMRLGLSHVLSVSGLHISATAGLVWLLCRRMRFNAWLSLLLMTLTLGVFVLFVGATPSVLRSAVMSMTLALAAVSYNQYDPFSALCLAFIFTLLLNPLDLFDVGFALSFSCTAGILLLSIPMTQRLAQRPHERLVVAPLALSLGAQAASLPLLLRSFQMFPVMGLVAGVVFVPGALALMFGGLAVLAVGWWPWLLMQAGTALQGMCTLYLRALGTLSAFALPIYTATPPVWLSWVYCGLLALCSPEIIHMRPSRRAVALCAAGVLCAVLLFTPASWMMGQPAAMALDEGIALSLCLGDDYDNTVVTNGIPTQAAAYLQARGRRSPTRVLLCARNAPDAQIFQTAFTGLLPRIYVPRQWADMPENLAFIEQIRAFGYIVGFIQQLDGCTLYGDPADTTGSLVLYTQQGGLRTLFAASISAADAQDALGACDLAVFATRSTRMAEYLQRAGAQVAVVSQPTDTLVLPGGAVYNINQHRGIALVDEPAGLVRIPPQNGALWNTRNFSIK